MVSIPSWPLCYFAFKLAQQRHLVPLRISGRRTRAEWRTKQIISGKMCTNASFASDDWPIGAIELVGYGTDNCWTVLASSLQLCGLLVPRHRSFGSTVHDCRLIVRSIDCKTTNTCRRRENAQLADRQWLANVPTALTYFRRHISNGQLNFPVHEFYSNRRAFFREVQHVIRFMKLFLIKLLIEFQEIVR